MARPAPGKGSLTQAAKDEDAPESDRLRENRALNRPVNTGETPVIKRRQRGLLEGVFD